MYFRKGYCAFAGAVATQDLRQFQAAVTELDKAIEAWPARMTKSAKHAVPEPVPPALRVFAAIARLHAAYERAGIDSAQQEITAAMESPSCKSNLMSATFCGQVLAAGDQWLGWIALRGNQLDQAARHFSATPDSGWSAWVQGRRDFDDARYAAAAAQYAQATHVWTLIWQGEGPTLPQALGPRPQLCFRARRLGRRALTGRRSPGRHRHARCRASGRFRPTPMRSS